MAALVGVTPSPRSGQALSRSEGSPRRQPRQRRCFAAAQHDGTRQFQLDSPLAAVGGAVEYWRNRDFLPTTYLSGTCCEGKLAVNYDYGVVLQRRREG